MHVFCNGAERRSVELRVLMIDRVRYEIREKAWDWAEDMSGRLILRQRS